MFAHVLCQATAADLQAQGHGGADNPLFRGACTACGGDHPEGECQPQQTKQSGGAKGMGKGKKGKGQAKSTVSNDSVVAFRCFDFIGKGFVR